MAAGSCTDAAKHFPGSMREAAGQSVKSAVSHSWVRDTRDDRLIGTRGSYIKLYQEFAGLGGDASFYKTEAHTQFARQLVPGVVSSIVPIVPARC